MVEPISTTGAVVATAYLTKKVLSRVLGPAADEVAAALARFTEHRLRNVGRVVGNANEKAKGTGSVPLRAAMPILEAASFADSDILVDYLGGLLASARTPSGRDDRAIFIAALISRLSTYDLRSHYIVYSEFERLLHGRGLNIYDSGDRERALVYFSLSSYRAGMDFGPGEDEDQIQDGVLVHLLREDLVLVTYAGSADHMTRQLGRTASGQARSVEAGMLLGPTLPGVELFLYARGAAGRPHSDFIEGDFEEFNVPGIHFPRDARRREDL